MMNPAGKKDRTRLTGKRVGRERKMEAEKIYLDMDGVLADFDRGVRELCRMEPQSQNGKRSAKVDDLMWEAIRKIDHFYDRLEPMPGAKEMFDIIYGAYGDRCEILTGIPRPERGLETAAQDKTDWMHRLFAGDVKVNAVCRKDKMQFCSGPEAVLIDDREKTIREWREKGGTGILHVSPEETLNELKQMGIL